MLYKTIMQHKCHTCFFSIVILLWSNIIFFKPAHSLGMLFWFRYMVVYICGSNEKITCCSTEYETCLRACNYKLSRVNKHFECVSPMSRKTEYIYSYMDMYIFLFFILFYLYLYLYICICKMHKKIETTLSWRCL